MLQCPMRRAQPLLEPTVSHRADGPRPRISPKADPNKSANALNRPLRIRTSTEDAATKETELSHCSTRFVLVLALVQDIPN
ncbi:hypothetical protein PC116_g30948 [Phytophthora cactorum]|nr:hypothetical protein PC116_g30948 [Phytophthora cactorum]